MNRVHAALKFLAAMYETGSKHSVMALYVSEAEWPKWQEDAHNQKELVYDIRADAIVLVHITGEFAREPRLYIFKQKGSG